MQDSIFYYIFLIVLIIIAISVFIWAVIRWTKLFMDKDSGTPLDIAKGRYAGGEITKEELEEIKNGTIRNIIFYSWSNIIRSNYFLDDFGNSGFKDIYQKK